MGATEKTFTHINSIPVQYTGGDDSFACTYAFYDLTSRWLRSLSYFSRTYGGSNYERVKSLQSQGFYANKDLAHGKGRAMDLAGVVWNGTYSSMLNGDHRSANLGTRRRYYAVEATCRRYYRYVLDGYYNADHANHFHCDDIALPTVCLKGDSRADTVFVQGLCNAFLGTSLAVDGRWGSATESALESAMSRLKVSGSVLDAGVWIVFCHRAAAHGFRNASFGYYDWYSGNRAYSWRSENIPGSYIRHRDSLGYISAPSTSTDRADATWVIRSPLTGTGLGLSLESRNFPGHYLRHQGARLRLSAQSSDTQFKRDATFNPRNGLWRDGGRWRSLEASNYPGHYIRHRGSELWLDRYDGSELFRRDATWSFDAPLTPLG